MIGAAFLFPTHGSWTIDDSVKRIAAAEGTGFWAERMPDGPVRSALDRPEDFDPLPVLFARRCDGGLEFGFAPLTRALFKLTHRAGDRFTRVAVALTAVFCWLVFARAGAVWSFLLLPLTFYGLVIWEHALSWLLLWPLVQRTLDDEAASWRNDVPAAVCFAVSVLLRPETAILGGVLGVYLLVKKRWTQAVCFALGGGGALALFLWIHDATSEASAFVQVEMNLPVMASGGFVNWIGVRLGAACIQLLSMHRLVFTSVILLMLLAGGIWMVRRADLQKKRVLLTGGWILLGCWLVCYQVWIWRCPLPPLAMLSGASLAACLPWIAVSFLPPFRNRTGFHLAVISMLIAILLIPQWWGVHWGPRLLLFIIPLFVYDLTKSGRMRGWLFGALLTLTAALSLGSAVLAYARHVEVADKIRHLKSRLGSPVVCPNADQCADLAGLWEGREFFTAGTSRQLRQLALEFRRLGVTEFQLHAEQGDSLYRAAFPLGKPVVINAIESFSAGRLYQTGWTVWNLNFAAQDTLWAEIMQQEAGYLVGEKRPEDALRLQREAVRLGMPSAKAYHNLAVILALLDRPAEARDAAQTALEIDPELQEARLLMETLPSPDGSAP